MKKYILTILITIGVIYLSEAFILNEFNALKWTQELRGTFIFLSVIGSYLSRLIWIFFDLK